jgi:hypothetical protein
MREETDTKNAFDHDILEVCSSKYTYTYSCFFFHSYEQTSISVEFKPLAGITNYELQWKSIEQKWSDPTISLTTAQGKKGKAEAADLNPGTSYCLRLVCIGNGDARGEPGPELIIDTEQVGCTPKSGGGGCQIL